MTSCKALSADDFAKINSLRGDKGNYDQSGFVSQTTSSNMATASGKTKRIVFTGGSGKAGRHVIPELIKKGYKVLSSSIQIFMGIANLKNRS